MYTNEREHCAYCHAAMLDGLYCPKCDCEDTVEALHEAHDHAIGWDKCVPSTLVQE